MIEVLESDPAAGRLEAGAPSTSRSFGVVILDAAPAELELVATPTDRAE
ncbi:MAG: hypothetical protein GY856_12150 [bacterium]|nr:hypothetical protein [bacterium]